ncbi:MAG: hypothetical protein CML17_05355 [Pusillimonas sp.]|jgi:hypothetical protein|nr:hypothetical protein [Pusillimonas sp.]
MGAAKFAATATLTVSARASWGKSKFANSKEASIFVAGHICFAIHKWNSDYATGNFIAWQVLYE